MMKVKNQEKVKLTRKDRIFITSLLYYTFKMNDTRIKNSILSYCSINLSDKQFKKIHKSCIKHIERSNLSVEDFNNFIRNI